jgi:hydroxyethylthiazole kinase-like sugar kinase family protein
MSGSYFNVEPPSQTGRCHYIADEEDLMCYDEGMLMLERIVGAGFVVELLMLVVMKLV